MKTFLVVIALSVTTWWMLRGFGKAVLAGRRKKIDDKENQKCTK